MLTKSACWRWNRVHKRRAPSSVKMCIRDRHYTGRQPIFDLFDVENEIQRALERKVELKSGGYLIIDQGRAPHRDAVFAGSHCGA